MAQNRNAHRTLVLTLVDALRREAKAAAGLPGHASVLLRKDLA